MKKIVGILLVLSFLVFPSATVTKADTGLQVQGYNSTTNSNSNSICFNVLVTNTGTNSISLSDVTLRYYFTADGSQSTNFACDYSPVGSSNVTGTFVTVSDSSFLQMGFSNAAGNLAAGASVQLNMRMWKSDWSNFDQSDDYSFDANAKYFVNTDKITAYVDGLLISGTESRDFYPVDPIATPAPTFRPDPTATPVPTTAPQPTQEPNNQWSWWNWDWSNWNWNWNNNPTPTSVPTWGPTATPVPTWGPTATPVPTWGPTATPVPTLAPTATPVPTWAPTATPVPSQSMKEISDAYMKNISISMDCPSNNSSHRNNVAYGSVVNKSYYSTTTRSNRKVNIILPANYSTSKKYPVLYVLHGIMGDENSMMDSSNRLVEIVGNAIADGRAKEMIVVCPNMYASADGTPAGITVQGMLGYDNFINDLKDNLMPFMEQNYSIRTEREYQAIVGFSMGGREALFIGITRPDLFGYCMGIAPAPGLTPGQDSFANHPGQLSENQLRIQNPNDTPYAIMVCAGTNDSVVGKFPESYHNILTRNSQNHIWYTVSGADHDSRTIQSGLNNFVGAIFHAND